MENLLFLGVPKFWAYYNLIIMCLNIGTPDKHHFPFGTNGKVVVLGVPILKYFRVCTHYYYSNLMLFSVSPSLGLHSSQDHTRQF